MWILHVSLLQIRKIKIKFHKAGNRYGRKQLYFVRGLQISDLKQIIRTFSYGKQSLEVDRFYG